MGYSCDSCGARLEALDEQCSGRCNFCWANNGSSEVAELRAEVERLQRLCGYMDPNYGVGSTVDKLRSRIADLDARHMQASKERNEAREESERLRVALRDAIRRPMGVVPESATGLIDECREEANNDE